MTADTLSEWQYVARHWYLETWRLGDLETYLSRTAWRYANCLDSVRVRGIKTIQGGIAMKMTRSVVLAAGVIGLLAGLAYAACPRTRHTVTPKTTLGATVTCNGQICPQNYCIDYTYGCGPSSGDNSCVDDTGVIQECFLYVCNPDPCTLQHPTTPGPTKKTITCPP
jgi:hypothetical protein